MGSLLDAKKIDDEQVHQNKLVQTNLQIMQKYATLHQKVGGLANQIYDCLQQLNSPQALNQLHGPLQNQEMQIESKEPRGRLFSFNP